MDHRDKLSGSSLYDVQYAYYNSGDHVDIMFEPLEWLALRIRSVLDSLECIKMYEKSSKITPHSVMHSSLVLYSKSCINSINKINIVKLALSDTTFDTRAFDAKRYYAMYNEVIDHFWTYQKDKEETERNKTLIFYICYGVHHNMNLVPVNSLVYIASSKELCDAFGCDEMQGAAHFYQNGGKISFDAVTYVASNWDNHKVRQFVKCDHTVDEVRASKHFIRHGSTDKTPTSSFDEWNYLANNYKRIRKILKREMGDAFEYDVLKLTKRSVASDFIIRGGKSKQNVFDSTKFVKAYIDDDEWVNKDKGLSISNAAEYFVKYYVLSERVRYETSWKYRIVMFLKGRAVDTMRQVPYNATRYLIESRCL